MLKRIDPTEVTLGMYIHKLEGSWLSHPFWRAKFLLDDPEQVSKLRNSDVPAVIIDIAKGRDVANAISRPAAIPQEMPAAEHVESPLPESALPESPLLESSPPESLTPESPALTPARPVRRRGNLVAPCSTAREFGRAAQVADRGIKTVSKLFYTMRLGKAVEPELITPVIDDVMASIQRNAHALNGMLRCQRDNEHVYRHALATSALMITLARQLQLSPGEVHRAGLAGLLLDSGIAVLPVDIAQYNSNPAAVPAHIMRDHVALGYEFVQGSHFGADIAQAVLEHHERIDGKGYPHATPGAQLSLLGRMAAVCDSYDDLANAEDGGAGLDPAQALAAMQRDTGAYDPVILSAFVAAMGHFPIGSIVELRSGRLAMVVDQGEGENPVPRGRVFYSAKLRQQVMQDEIELGGGDDAITGPADEAVLEGLDLAVVRHRLITASAAVPA